MQAKGVVHRLLGERLYHYLFYCRTHRRMLIQLGLSTSRADGEDAYLQHWLKLDRWVDPYAFRLYRHYCGPSPDILPEDILHDVIEPVINPVDYWPAYEDKNLFHCFVGRDCLPETLLCRIGGGHFLDACMHPVASIAPILEASRHGALILKPSIGTSCGEGICRFQKVGVAYCDVHGRQLDDDYLRRYGDNWVLQEALHQHPFMEQFCHSAVNTVRIAVYRSVCDGKAHITGALLRVGKEGALVDNVSSGGRFVGIDAASGRLLDAFVAFDGSRSARWNDMDLSQQTLYVPRWDELTALACRVAESIPHHHLLALDIALCENEKPMLVEYNIGGFSAYIFHHVGQTVFGAFTDEVIDYVKSRRPRL